MDKITPKIILPYITERANRLSAKSPFARKKRHIDYRHPSVNVEHLCTTGVDSNQFDYCMSILESLSKTDVSAANGFAKYMATNIVNGINTDVLATIDIDSYSITEDAKSTLSNALYRTATCQRVLTNQEKLSKRFNVDKIVRENIYRPERAINELCSLIDTYEIPPHYKMNIAMENVAYTLYKNGATISDSDMLDLIVEYFMNRDMTISDDTYGNYKRVLEENTIFSEVIPHTSVAKEVLNNPGNYYSSMMNKVFSESDDSYISTVLLQEANNINTEADAYSFIEDISSYMDTNNLTEDEIARLGCAVNNISNYSPVSDDFVKIKSKEIFDKDNYDKLCSCDCVIPSKQSIEEKDIFSDIFDKSSYLNTFNEAEGVSGKNDIDTLIAKFKAEQDKSPNKVKQFITKLHTKSPESIIKGIPDIMNIVRIAIIIALAAVTPIGPIIAAVTALISWLLSRKINEKEATRLLNTIRSEKTKIKNKIEKTSNDKKKKELESYLSSLESSESKVEEYLEGLDGEDRSDNSDDDLDDDLDVDFECTVQNVSNILTMTNEVMEFDASKLSMFDNIEKLAKAGLLNDISTLVAESSISIKDYTDLLTDTYNNSNNVIVRTAITSSLNSIRKGSELPPCRAIIAANIANKALEEASYEIVQEKVNLNNIKLQLQNAKSKLKELSTKEKSMWQTVDAQSSGLVKSIEKAMTSDRREAIIKGSIIPSFSKCIKGAIALAGIGIFFGPLPAIIAGVGGMAVSTVLNNREKKLIYDEIETELKVVEKQAEIAQNDGDMNQYRFLLNYQKKLTREAQRIKYGLKVKGRDIPAAVLPGQGGR